MTAAEEPAPLTPKNAKLARAIGWSIGRWRDAAAPFAVQLWVRSEYGEPAPSDELQFKWRDGRPQVALRTEPELFAALDGEAPEDRWLDVASAAEEVDRWAELVPLEVSRELLASFLAIVRASAIET